MAMKKVTLNQPSSISTNLSVDEKSAYYNMRQMDWSTIGIIMQGERAVRAAGQRFVPILSKQTSTEYAAYLSRGSFYNAFARTVQGLTGAITRKPVVLELPEKMEDISDNFTKDGISIDKTVRDITQEIISQGYCGMLADLDDKGKPYASVYSPLDIYNFRLVEKEGQKVLAMLALHEIAEEIDGLDYFKINQIDQIRVLSLDELGWLTVNLYRYDVQIKGGNKKWIQVPIRGEYDYHPTTVGGLKLDYIPFVFFGADKTSFIPQKPPLLDLVYLNIKHWQVSVDYYYALHICALPTPWAAGFDQIEGKELKIGSGTAWVSKTPEAKCGFLEFTGQGLGAIEKALDRLERQMAVIGARFLEEQKKGVEAVETLEIRSSGDTANLASISVSIEQGFKQILIYMAKWIKVDWDKIEVTLSKDFVSAKMEPAMITALLGALQANRISIDTFLYSLQEGEILPTNVTIEDEKAKLELKEQENPYLPSLSQEE